MPQTTTNLRDAIRLLFILIHGSEPITDHPDGYTRKFEGKAKVFAMDFWVRYPDFLAYELLNRFEATNERRYLDLAKDIFDKEEPDLRSIPMIRYRFGAYEDLTETLALLKTKGLIFEDGDKSNGLIQQCIYYVTPLCEEVLEDIRNESSLLGWYDDRALLVREICGNYRGSQLKDEQYKHMVYASTKFGGVIPSIKQDVLQRLNKFN
ncbi:hypothetical protein [Pedobacter immunditicola]|uniref:hypothetical protein n=1 Tax=Pedobacter immunditicola TaxID=3133440 RepID=UPI0030A27619